MLLQSRKPPDQFVLPKKTRSLTTLSTTSDYFSVHSEDLFSVVAKGKSSNNSSNNSAVEFLEIDTEILGPLLV